MRRIFFLQEKQIARKQPSKIRFQSRNNLEISSKVISILEKSEESQGKPAKLPEILGIFKQTRTTSECILDLKRPSSKQIIKQEMSVVFLQQVSVMLKDLKDFSENCDRERR